MIPMINDGGYFKLMSIDPGSSNLGYSLLEFDFDKKEINLLDVKTFNVKSTNSKYRNLLDYHEDKYIRLMMLKDALKNLLEEHSPHSVIAESNYMGKFANGFAALVECVLVIRMALYEHDPFMKLFMIDPTTVKVNIGMKKVRGTTKDDVRRALVASKKINWNGFKAADLDEHSIDAIAIGVWYMENAL